MDDAVAVAGEGEGASRLRVYTAGFAVLLHTVRHALHSVHCTQRRLEDRFAHLYTYPERAVSSLKHQRMPRARCLSLEIQLFNEVLPATLE